MKDFKFPLESVLKYRDMLLEDAKKAYAAALGEVVRKEREIAALKTHRGEVNAEFNGKKARGLIIPEAAHYTLYLDEVDDKIDEETENLHRLEVIAREKQQLLIEANRDYRAIEILRENAQTEYDAMVRKAEEKMIDEFVANAMSAAREQTA